jgi:PKD repeat protein
MQVAQRVFASLIVTVFVAGCGGGGGGGGSTNPPPAPTSRPPQTPVITLSAASTRPGIPVTMTAASTDPQSSPIAYSWTFGDGATATGANVSHTYATEGTFAVGVTATNGLNLSASATTSLPVAYLGMVNPSIFATNEGHFLGQSFTAQAAILEPNGLPLTYRWDFGDGTTSDKLNALHTYAATGTYNVTFTGTNSANRSVSAAIVVNVHPRSTLPARTDNAFSAFCSGTFCGAADADTYSGQGVGVWRYHNAAGAPASVNVVIDGMSGGHTASLVFTNGQAVDTPTAPSVGMLMSSVVAPKVISKARRETSLAEEATAHTQMLESNAASAREYLSKRSSSARVVSKHHKAVTAKAVPPAVGTQRTWNDLFGGITPYEMQVATSCALPSGRNAVFWLDSAQVAAGQISAARIQHLVDGFCGDSGAYATLTGIVGDVWGPDAAGSGFIEDAPGALQDLHIVMPGVPNETKWGGYFAGANLSPKSANPASNEALAVFVNPVNLVRTPDDGITSTGSTLVHELKHHINFYQRTIVRARSHAVWLEETSAMLAEDLLPLGLVDDSRTWARHQGYLGGGGGIGYVGWTHPEGGSYNFGGTFAGFLHRWYGVDIDRKLITDCDDHGSPTESYQCMDALIVQQGGVSFADELERMGATVYGGMGRGSVPDGFGLPSIVREGFELISLESSSARDPELATFAPLSTGYLATSHTYHLDVIGAGQTVYRRDNVEIPAGATLIVVVQN